MRGERIALSLREEIEMPHIRVDYDRHEYVTRHGRADDQWDRDDTAAIIGINGIEVVSEPSYRDLSVPFEIDFNRSYLLLWADYNTGDSFGHDANRVEFIDLFETIERAEAARQKLSKATEYSSGYTREDGTGISYHIPWNGYFESLNDINITVVRVTKIR